VPLRIIINADDFGLSPDVNEAVAKAHRHGILTSASLIVAGDAWEHAVDLARQMPRLALGLHVLAVNGPAVLPTEHIPLLLDHRGRFPNAPLRLGLLYFLNRRARRQLERELHAQFDRFAATGLPLSHVDGHMHMHVHPAVFTIVLKLAVEYRARGFRLPRDEWWPPRVRTPDAIVMRCLSAPCAKRLRQRGLAVPRRCYGLARSGRMDEQYVLDLLRRINAPSAEIYFHPACDHRLDPAGPNPGDLATLLSPAVRQEILSRGMQLSTYADIQEA